MNSLEVSPFPSPGGNQVRFPEGQGPRKDREITQGGANTTKLQAEETECRIVLWSTAMGKFWELRKGHWGWRIGTWWLSVIVSLIRLRCLGD